METYDVLVVGGGPGGYSLAIAAAKNGLKVALFEKEHLGGVCLNEGCIPTKYLVDKAVALEKVRSLTEREIFRDPGFFSFRKIQNGKTQVVQKLVGGVQFLLKKHGVSVVTGEAVLGENRTVRCNGEVYQGKNVVIATGSVPATIPFPGHEWTIGSREVLAFKQLPCRMVIVGGGVIGLEIACTFAMYGTEVTVIEMLPALLPREQTEAVALVVAALQKAGVHIITGGKVLQVEKRGTEFRVVYERDGSRGDVEADQVLMAVGRKANLSGIDAQAIGLKLDEKNYIQVDKAQRTNLEGVYAIGDVTGGIQLAHVAYAEGETALTHILTGKLPEHLPPVPSCIYTIPCFASVGLNTVEAERQGFEPVLGTFDYSANGMALAEGASGKVFVVMDKATEQTLGVTIVGENASELIAFGALAVDQRLTVEQWRQMIVAHPSLAEMVREAALDAFGAAVHKS